MTFPLVPKPPTDNLYKFLALSGIVLLIFTTTFWAHFYVTQVERTRLAFELMRESIPPYQYFIAKALIQDGKPVKDEEKQLVAKYDTLQAESRKAGSDFQVYEQFRYIITGISILFGVASIILVGFGIYLWYTRVQIPLDLILKNQTKETSEDN